MSSSQNGKIALERQGKVLSRIWTWNIFNWGVSFDLEGRKVDISILSCPDIIAPQNFTWIKIC